MLIVQANCPGMNLNLESSEPASVKLQCILRAVHCCNSASYLRHRMWWNFPPSFKRVRFAHLWHFNPLTEAEGQKRDTHTPDEIRASCMHHTDDLWSVERDTAHRVQSRNWVRASSVYNTHMIMLHTDDLWSVERDTVHRVQSRNWVRASSVYNTHMIMRHTDDLWSVERKRHSSRVQSRNWVRASSVYNTHMIMHHTDDLWSEERDTAHRVRAGKLSQSIISV